MSDVKVLIGVPTDENTRRSDFYDYLNQMRKPINSLVGHFRDRSPARNRNIIAREAINHNCTHVLYIDDDQAFEKNALEQLLEHDKDIVSGLYLSRAYPHHPLIFEYADDQGRQLPYYLDGNIKERLIPIVGAGLGFVLINTRVFKGMEYPWIRMGELDPENWCDDIGFFNRALAAGFKAYCDTECRVGHMGAYISWPKLIEGKWYTMYDTGGKGGINIPQIVPAEQTYVTYAEALEK